MPLEGQISALQMRIEELLRGDDGPALVRRARFLAEQLEQCLQLMGERGMQLPTFGRMPILRHRVVSAEE